MKTKLLLLLLLASTIGNAQWNRINSYGTQYKRLRADQGLAIPQDTFSIEPADRLLPHIAAKDTTLYLWSIVLQRWNAVGSANTGNPLGGGLNYTFLSPFVVNGSEVSLGPITQDKIAGGIPSSKIVGTFPSTVITGTKTSDYISDLGIAVRRYFSAGTGLRYDTTTGQFSLATGTGSSFSSIGEGLVLSSGVLSAKHFTPMWNASRIQGYQVSAAAPQHGQTLVYNDSTGQLQWGASIIDTTTSQPPPAGGSGYIPYEQEFPGTSSGMFFLPRPPVAGSIEVWINGLKVPPSCLTRTVNTILVSQACAGFNIIPSDNIIIKYQSTQ